jgi:hypothetical protein
MYIGLHVKYPLLLSDFNETFSRQIFEKYSNIKLMKIHLVEAELCHADGRTDGRTDRQADVTKLMVAFRNFANAPKKKIHLLTQCTYLCVSHDSQHKPIISLKHIKPTHYSLALPCRLSSLECS